MIWVISCTPGVMIQLVRSPHPETGPTGYGQAHGHSRHTLGSPVEQCPESPISPRAQAPIGLFTTQPRTRTQSQLSDSPKAGQAQGDQGVCWGHTASSVRFISSKPREVRSLAQGYTAQT